MRPPRPHTRFDGIGLGLRQPLAHALLQARPKGLAFLEIHPENYVERGGTYPAMLEQAKEHWPVLSHGLTLGLGNTEPFEKGYVKVLRQFLSWQLKTPWHSEHLCFTQADGRMLHDLLPLPFNKSAIQTAVQRIRELRDALEIPIAIENVSYYANLEPPRMPEVEFLLEVLDKADALLLLDVNNVYVNSINHGFDPRAYLDCIPPERVVQLHIAGHLVRPDGIIIDTHAEPICDPVYDLLDYTLRRLGPRPVLLERDDRFPEFHEILGEINRLQAIYQRAVQPLNLMASTA
jgi:uncharacterized protein (UPF0276 family)